MTKKPKIHHRSDFVECPNCFRGISIKDELFAARKKALEELYDKIVEEWADSANIQLYQIKEIIKKLKLKGE